MNIIAHRGFWKTDSEKNTLIALQRAIESGFGFETDFRDCGGKILISHNPPKGNELEADKVFEMYNQCHCDMTLALNIKADGLQDVMKLLLEKYDIKNYFFFDMSVCDTILYTENKLTIATRQSEYEKEYPFYDDSEFVWLDYFNKDATLNEIERHLRRGKKVCLVSPDLHKRPYQGQWDTIKRIDDNNLYLCTDYPDKAKEYFSK
ncbi:hypothetical protein [Prevotella sp.]|uniref:hypothetical protein n=1 Tax=Prevotella sp. TaxID=59823 RepID=UPI00264A1294|nr:hypothetical protein [Prevotella sp.]MDN5554340.1 hypothetical protein [Prevotella sp.]